MTGVGDGGIPSDYFVSSQLQLWLFCCWGWGCCWAVTIAFFLFLNFYDVSSLSCSHSRIIQYFIETFLCNLQNHIIFYSLHLFSIGQYKGRREPNAGNILVFSKISRAFFHIFGLVACKIEEVNVG